MPDARVFSDEHSVQIFCELLEGETLEFDFVLPQPYDLLVTCGAVELNGEVADPRGGLVVVPIEAPLRIVAVQPARVLASLPHELARAEFGADFESLRGRYGGLDREPLDPRRGVRRVGRTELAQEAREAATRGG